MNIIELRDKDQTVWYSSNTITNIAKAAELLNHAIEADEEPTKATVERLGGRDLQPLTHQEYMAALNELATGSGRGFVAEIDLLNDSGCFTHIPPGAKKIHSVYGMISRITGIYQMSIDSKTKALDSSAFTEGLIHHCDWVRYNSAQERFETQSQQQAPDQNMTVQ